MKEVKRYLLDTFLCDPVLVTKTELGFLKIERYMDDDSEVVLAQDFDSIVKERDALQAAIRNALDEECNDPFGVLREALAQIGDGEGE